MRNSTRETSSQKGFGSSIAVQGDTLVVGAPGGDRGGRVSVFVKPRTGWANATPVAILTATYSGGEGFFGHSVAIDGDTIVVGDPDSNDYEGSAYVFVKPNNGWKSMTETATLRMSNGMSNDQFGSSVSVSGNTIVVGAPYAPCCQRNGRTYVYVKPAKGWTNSTETAQITASDQSADDAFGNAVSLRGSTLAIAAYGAGAGAGRVYVFKKPPNGWSHAEQLGELTASDGASGDLLGIYISFEGNTIVAGAVFKDDERGAAYVFVKPASGWTSMVQTAKLTASDGQPGDLMSAVSTTGNIVLAGAASNGSHTTAAYVFVKPVGGWNDMTETQKFPGNGDQDFFGAAVGIVGTTLFIGAPGQLVEPHYYGVTYVFAK